MRVRGSDTGGEREIERVCVREIVCVCLGECVGGWGGGERERKKGIDVQMCELGEAIQEVKVTLFSHIRD